MMVIKVDECKVQPLTSERMLCAAGRDVSSSDAAACVRDVSGDVAFKTTAG